MEQSITKITTAAGIMEAYLRSALYPSIPYFSDGRGFLIYRKYRDNKSEQSPALFCLTETYICIYTVIYIRIYIYIYLGDTIYIDVYIHIVRNKFFLEKHFKLAFHILVRIECYIPAI